MNIFAVIILTIIIFSFLFEALSDTLNLKKLAKTIPAEFEDVYDAETYANSQNYTRVNTKFSTIRSLFALVILMLFWFSGGFNQLDILVRSWGYGEIVTGLIYIGILLTGYSVLLFPFGLYSTFVIEERFGFNKTTLKTYFLDLVKGALLGVLIGAPILALILAFFMYAGSYAWVYAWGCLLVISIFMQYISPKWIMPIFNKFTPLEEGELKSTIMDYAQKVDFPISGLFVIDGSRRSSKSNAFFTGFGKNKRIALYDTLIENHTTEELVSILAHEIGHYKKKHIIKGMFTGFLHSGLLFFLLSVFLYNKGLYEAFYMENTSIYSGLLFFSLLFGPVDTLLSIFIQLMSRKHEYEADAFAVHTTRRPEVMVSTLKKLSKDNLSNLTPHPLYVFLNYSHPPVLERIKAIRNI